MAEAIEWIGMIVFAIVIGGFIGFVGSGGDLVPGLIGAAVLIVLSAVYLLTIEDDPNVPAA